MAKEVQGPTEILKRRRRRVNLSPREGEAGAVDRSMAVNSEKVTHASQSRSWPDVLLLMCDFQAALLSCFMPADIQEQHVSAALCQIGGECCFYSLTLGLTLQRRRTVEAERR